MRDRNYGSYAIAAAIVVVGLLWLGVPVGNLAWLGLVLACPLMMLFMMRGMHGGHGHGRQSADQGRQHDHSAH